VKRRTGAASPLRGQIWFVDVPALGEKPFVIVSNNPRNDHLSTVLGVRITTALKPALRSIVRLPGGEPLKGSVLCDDIALLSRGRLKRSSGALSAKAMTLVDAGLRHALALR
jgi:mRNA interferase MazF